MELVTGRAGKAHVTSQQDRMKNQGIFGADSYILSTGKNLAPEVQSSNEIRIRDGAIMVQGALGAVKVNTYDSVTIQNGNQGMKRIDLICWQYTYDAEQDIESADWIVIQGTPAEDDPQQPVYTSGSIQEGDTVVQVPVFAIHLDGINVTGVDTLLSVIQTNADLSDSVRQLNANYIVEEGENDNGHYRKWSNGTLEMWGGYRGTFSIPSGNVQGNIYYSANRTIPFPIESKTSARIVATVYSNGIQWLKTSTSNTNKTGFDVVIMQPTGANPTANVNWSAIGTWK